MNQAKPSTGSGQAQRVYVVENSLWEALDQASDTGIRDYHRFGTTYTLPNERKFGSLESVHIYLERLTGLKSFYAEFGSIVAPAVKPTTRDSNGAYRQTSADADGMAINLAPHGGGVSTHLREMRVLHEMAHAVDIQIARRNGTKTDGHSKGFLDIFLKLIRIAMDDEMFVSLFRYMLMENGAKL